MRNDEREKPRTLEGFEEADIQSADEEAAYDEEGILAKLVIPIPLQSTEYKYMYLIH